MNKLLMLLFLAGTMPLASLAQDDVYFIPKKVKKEAPKAEQPAYYCGSSRSVDEYNRRGQLNSWYQKIGSDTLGNDIIAFQGGVGVYPDSVYVDTAYVYPGSADFATGAIDDDFTYTRRMSRWDGYYDPWFYDNYWRCGYSLYNPWYGPWRYGWYGGWYDPWYAPWYYGYAGWYSPWYYGWGYPYHWGYAGWYGPHGGFAYVGRPGTRNHGYVARGNAGGYGGRFGNRQSNGSYAYGGNAQRRLGARSVSGTNNSNTSRNRTFGSRSYPTQNSTPSYSNTRSTGSFGGGSFGGGSRGGGFSGGGHSGGGGGGHFGGRR